MRNLFKIDSDVKYGSCLFYPGITFVGKQQNHWVITDKSTDPWDLWEDHEKQYLASGVLEDVRDIAQWWEENWYCFNEMSILNPYNSAR